MNLGERFQYHAPWCLTRWGLTGGALRPQRGCDEWHNPSWYLVVPFVGWLVWFPKAGFDRDGPEHLYAWGPWGHEGYIAQGCEICEEMVDER